MLKRKIKLGALFLFLVCSVFFLAGCAKNQEEKNQNQTQNQSQEKTQKQEQVNSEKLKGSEEAEKGSAKRMKGSMTQMTQACNGKAAGDSCEVSRPMRESDESGSNIAGTCKKMEEEIVACVPNDMPQGGPNSVQPSAQ